VLHSVEKSPQLIQFVLNHLRKQDEFEMIEQFGINFKNIVFDVAMNSEIYGIVDDDNNFVGFYGVRKISEDVAEICLLSTDKLKLNGVSFLLQARKYIELWKIKYKKLQNFVYKKNTLAIKWLKWLGFTLVNADDKRMFFYR